MLSLMAFMKQRAHKIIVNIYERRVVVVAPCMYKTKARLVRARAIVIISHTQHTRISGRMDGDVNEVFFFFFTKINHGNAQARNVYICIWLSSLVVLCNVCMYIKISRCVCRIYMYAVTLIAISCSNMCAAQFQQDASDA